MNGRLGLVCLTLLFLAGCTTTGHGPITSATGGTASTTLRWPLGSEPTVLDPVKAQDLDTIELLAQCFEGLVQYDENNNLVPDLAEKWELSPDGKTYTFHIRHGVKFHNGRELTAEDVRYSWERALAPATGSSLAANYLDGIQGLTIVTNGQKLHLPGLQVVDPYTLKVTLDRPRSYFLGMLTYPTGFVVCREAIEKTGGQITEQSLIGTGPFRFESYLRGQRVTFTANPGYWNGKPKTDRLERPILLDPETIYNNFRTNAIDFTGGDLNHYVQDKAAGRYTDEYKVQPYAMLDYLVMQRVKQPVFAKREVRQAIGMAIDRNEIFKVSYKSVGKVADGVLPPELPNVGPNPPPIPYDPGRAKQLLAQAGFPNGQGFPTLTLTILQHSPVNSATAQIIRSNLHDNLGISVNIQELEAAQYYSSENKRSMEFFLAEWIADYPDPQNFISTLFVSTASLNRSHYANPQMDALCSQADQERDPAKRAEEYGKANAILMEDVGVLPLTFGPQIHLIQKGVTGYRINLCRVLPQTQTTKAP